LIEGDEFVFISKSTNCVTSGEGMKTNKSPTNIFPDSSNQFANVNQPCACLSTEFMEQTGINGTGIGQKQHKHIGIF